MKNYFLREATKESPNHLPIRAYTSFDDFHRDPYYRLTNRSNMWLCGNASMNLLNLASVFPPDPWSVASDLVSQADRECAHFDVSGNELVSYPAGYTGGPETAQVAAGGPSTCDFTSNRITCTGVEGMCGVFLI